MDQPEMNYDHELLERVNPVFNTAKMTLYQLSSAGDENARIISEQLGLTFENTQDSSEGLASAEESVMNCILLETRYRTMGRLAEKSGCPTVIDLPCGYTPRAIEFAKKGIPFVGMDLPAVISETEPVIRQHLTEEQQEFVRFEGVDATNYSSLEKAFDPIRGEVCITTEGLLMYFTDSEADMLCENIAKILELHGGCWIMADPEVTLHYIAAAWAFFGDRFMEVLTRSGHRASEKSDVDVHSNSLVIDPKGNVKKNMQNAMLFLSKYGLKVERMVLSDHAPELKSLDKADQAQKEAVLQAMKNIAYWKVTSTGNMLDASDTKAENFETKARISGERLLLEFHGRLDTLSAPNLLSFFEKTAQENELREVEIDCRSLDYISSAGLRVLLIMKKKCEKGVTLSGANSLVLEILDQTGFMEFFRIS
ncbi:MAG: STAS domain-containing protein [Lachnospiraceae bacterium]|nr:STAS domain-containing protein [Lachnospiraceae bacterium]